jgi:hypothetical protein
MEIQAGTGFLMGHKVNDRFVLKARKREKLDVDFLGSPGCWKKRYETKGSTAVA